MKGRTSSSVKEMVNNESLSFGTEPGTTANSLIWTMVNSVFHCTVPCSSLSWYAMCIIEGQRANVSSSHHG